MKWLLSFLLFLAVLQTSAQNKEMGIVIGTVLDEKNKALEAATVELISYESGQPRSGMTDKDGAFQFSRIPFGFYHLRISFVGFHTLTIDSIHFREERYDFNLNDVVLKPRVSDSGTLEQVIIYAEKPLIQSRDGNITFNAGESALSAGSNASDLLTNVPLVTKDPDGKLLVRGREPRILIDDKPVELNLQQLQDLLESMPGSSVEKIEVMTNPPPQYANEQGGVINIVTKKGTVGKSGRLSIYAGTRGEKGANGSFNYRKQGFSLNINAGGVNNRFEGNGYSRRQNIFTDSVNYFNTDNRYQNHNLRPNIRANMNWDINKLNSVNLVLNYNSNHFDNENFTQITNLTSAREIYRLSERTLTNSGESSNPGFNFSYTHKTKRPGESLRLIYDFNSGNNESSREFYQQYFHPDHTPNGKDSTQEQFTTNRSSGHSTRLNYDLPFNNKKTTINAGSFYSASSSRISSDGSYFNRSQMHWLPVMALINRFRFRQQINTFRLSVKQMLGTSASTTAGMAAEYTRFHFNLYKAGMESSNTYWSYLPFATFNKNWNQKTNLSLSYRKTIRRPGSNELNPTVDSTDAYTIRTGNTDLKPSLSHNFDMVLGKTKNSFYANIGMGYNRVTDVFAQIRTRISDTTTQSSWEYISG